MSLTPSTSSRYASPAPSTPSIITTSKAKQKPVNVFSDDGSFLERFQRPKMEDEEKRKAEEALATKRQFSDRFKTRGKRHLPPPDPSSAVSTINASAAKKPKLDKAVVPLANCQKEAHNQEGRAYKVTDTGVRTSVR